VPRLTGRFVAKYIPPAETLTDSVPCPGALEFRTDTLSGMASLSRSVRRRSIGRMEDNPQEQRELQDQNDIGGKKGDDVPGPYKRIKPCRGRIWSLFLLQRQARCEGHEDDGSWLHQGMFTFRRSRCSNSTHGNTHDVRFLTELHSYCPSFWV